MYWGWAGRRRRKKISKLPDPLIAVDPLFHQNSGVLWIFPWEYVTPYYWRYFKVPMKQKTRVLSSFQTLLSPACPTATTPNLFQRQSEQQQPLITWSYLPHIMPILSWAWVKSKETPAVIFFLALTSDSVKVAVSPVLVLPSPLQSAKRPSLCNFCDWDDSSEAHCPSPPQCPTNELCTFMFAYNFAEVDCLYALSLASSFHFNTLFYLYL